MAQENAPSYSQEEASFGSRETALSALFGYAPARAYNALEQAAERQGLTVLMSSAANGLLVARPSLSLLNLGRRVTVAVSPAGPEAARVSARYTHGLVSFEDRYARLELLNTLLRNALLQLEAGDVARKVARQSQAPAPAAEAAPPAEPAGDQPAYPTLNELRAKARAEELARHGMTTDDPEAQAFLREAPEGIRLPGRFKARRIFWFALGVVLAAVIMVLMSLAQR
jgi:hypothetical protein